MKPNTTEKKILQWNDPATLSHAELFELVEIAQREACAGRFFNRIDIEEEMHIPDELVKHIEERAVQAERKRIRELEDEELRSLVGALYDEFCETQLATEQQWNEAIAPKLKRLANVIRGLDPESVTARQYKFPRHLLSDK